MKEARHEYALYGSTPMKFKTLAKRMFGGRSRSSIYLGKIDWDVPEGVFWGVVTWGTRV